MAEQITLEKKTEIERPILEISPTGNITIVLHKAPANFEQAFDDENQTYTFRASWRG